MFRPYNQYAGTREAERVVKDMYGNTCDRVSAIVRLRIIHRIVGVDLPPYMLKGELLRRLQARG